MAAGGYSQRRALVAAAIVLLLVKNIVPFGRVFLYPLTLLATWVHELGHGLSALVVGGRFAQLEVFADASGLAHTAVAHGWRNAVVAAGGLLMPPLAGLGALALSRTPRRARGLLFGVAGTLLVSSAIWVRSAAGLIAMPIVGAALVWVALRARPERRLIAAQLLGLTLALDTVTRLDYLFTASVEVDGARRTSDVAAIAETVGGHYLLWGLLLAAVSLGAAALGLWIAWRRREGAPATPRRA